MSSFSREFLLKDLSNTAGERVVSDDNVKSRPPRNVFIINFCFEGIIENRGQVFWKCGIM